MPELSSFLGIVSRIMIPKVTKAEYEKVNDVMFEQRLTLLKKKKNAYVFPAGGSTTLGIWGYINFINELKKQVDLSKINSIVAACMKMAETNEGALIVVTRQNELLQYVSTGQEMNATISAQLIESIFFKNSPLHDGAMIISHNSIKAAACILPVTKKKVDSNVGLRHRAAIGITEVSDAIAIIVSEETGTISYCLKGELEFDLQPRDLQEKLIADMEL